MPTVALEVLAHTDTNLLGQDRWAPEAQELSVPVARSAPEASRLAATVAQRAEGERVG